MPTWLKGFFGGMVFTLIVLISVYEYSSYLERQQDVLINQWDTKMLPKDSFNVEALGNHWIKFDLIIKGEKHTFIYQRQNNSTITQLK